MGINTIELAQQLIRCESVTPTNAGVMELLCHTLEPLGVHCDRQLFHEEGTEPVDNLYASVGNGGRNLCFAGLSGSRIKIAFAQRG